jgi:hypothetical protein
MVCPQARQAASYDVRHLHRHPTPRAALFRAKCGGDGAQCPRTLAFPADYFFVFFAACLLAPAAMAAWAAARRAIGTRYGLQLT